MLLSLLISWFLIASRYLLNISKHISDIVNQLTAVRLFIRFFCIAFPLKAFQIILHFCISYHEQNCKINVYHADYLTPKLIET